MAVKKIVLYERDPDIFIKKYYSLKSVAESYLFFTCNEATRNKKIKDQSAYDLLYLLAQYLFHIKKMEPLMIEKILKRYILLCVYSLANLKGTHSKIDLLISGKMSEKEIYNFYINETLPEDKNDFYILFNDDFEPDKIKTATREIENRLKDNNLNSKTSLSTKLWHHSIVSLTINYFKITNNPIRSDKFKRIDTIIAESINEKNVFDFYFRLVNVQTINNNIINEPKEKDDTSKFYYIIMLGFVIDGLLKSKGKPFKIKTNVLQFITESMMPFISEKDECQFKFLSLERSDDGYLCSLNNEIEPFEFIYGKTKEDARKYRLDKEKGVYEI